MNFGKLKMIYLCGVTGTSGSFITGSTKVADEWRNQNKWHWAKAIPQIGTSKDLLYYKAIIQEQHHD